MLNPGTGKLVQSAFLQGDNERVTVNPALHIYVEVYGIKPVLIPRSLFIENVYD